MAWVAAAIAAGAAIYGASKQASSSKAAANQQQQFQQWMSSSAHQRQVIDLRSAGLNPILSARYGGSSTPAGAQPAQIPDIAGRATSSALSAYNIAAHTKKMEAETELTRRMQTTEGYRTEDMAASARQKIIAGNLGHEQIKMSNIAQVLEALRTPGAMNEAELQKAVGSTLKALGPAKQGLGAAQMLRDFIFGKGKR